MGRSEARVQRAGIRVLKFDGAFGPEGYGRLSAAGYVRFRSGGDSACGAEGGGIARRAMSIIMPPFGGHVHIEYHNHSYPRTSLRHFVALFP